MKPLSLYVILLTLWTSITWGTGYGASAEIALTFALTLVWGALISESVERGLLHRRLWVASAINPRSRLYRLLWGGALFVIIRALIVAPIALILFCHLLTQTWLEWIALFLSAWITLAVRAWIQRRLEPLCSPLYTEFLSRRGSVICAATLLIPLFILVALWTPQVDMRGLKIGDALALAEPESSQLPSPFDLISYIAHGAENAYSWCFQTMLNNLDSLLSAWLKYLLLLIFIAHKSLVAFASARLLSGLMVLRDFEQIKLRLAQVRYLQDTDQEQK